MSTYYYQPTAKGDFPVTDQRVPIPLLRRGGVVYVEQVLQLHPK
jgi:hypothetical protein